MSTCIFPGKFDPFHTGHLMVVKGMMSACPKTVIAICTDLSKDKLFNSEEVREMISAALLSADIVDANIAVVEDCENDQDWVASILESAGNPEDPQVWSGNEAVIDLFEEAGISTKKIVHVPGIDSKEIREMIRSSDMTWRTKVPAGALDVIEKKARRFRK